MIPKKGSGRPCKRALGHRRFWDLGALGVGQYRVVSAGGPIPSASIRKATRNTGYRFTTRKQADGTTRIYRAS